MCSPCDLSIVKRFGLFSMIIEYRNFVKGDCVWIEVAVEERKVSTKSKVWFIRLGKLAAKLWVTHLYLSLTDTHFLIYPLWTGCSCFSKGDCFVLFFFTAKGLDHIAENILSFLDANSLCAAEIVCKEWYRVISDGMLWKKLIERKVRTDPLWRGLSERRGWYGLKIVQKLWKKSLFLRVHCV